MYIRGLNPCNSTVLAEAVPIAFFYRAFSFLVVRIGLSILHIKVLHEETFRLLQGGGGGGAQKENSEVAAH